MLTNNTFEELLLTTARILEERNNARQAVTLAERETQKFKDFWLQEQTVTSNLRSEVRSLSEVVDALKEAVKTLTEKMHDTSLKLFSLQGEVDDKNKELQIKDQKIVELEKRVSGLIYECRLPTPPEETSHIMSLKTECADCRKEISGPVWGTVVCAECVQKEA